MNDSVTASALYFLFYTQEQLDCHSQWHSLFTVNSCSLFFLGISSQNFRNHWFDLTYPKVEVTSGAVLWIDRCLHFLKCYVPESFEKQFVVILMACQISLVCLFVISRFWWLHCCMSAAPPAPSQSHQVSTTVYYYLTVARSTLGTLSDRGVIFRESGQQCSPILVAKRPSRLSGLGYLQQESITLGSLHPVP